VPRRRQAGYSTVLDRIELGEGVFGSEDRQADRPVGEKYIFGRSTITYYLLDKLFMVAQHWCGRAVMILLNLAGSDNSVSMRIPNSEI
jgi:hypothetical protein